MSTKAQIALAQAKETAGTSLRINTVCNLQTVKSGAELNTLLLKFLLLCQLDIQESSRKDNAKFSFLGIVRQSQRSLRDHVAGFQRA